MTQFTRGQLKLAFTWHIGKEIVEGDIVVAEEEEDWLARAFPREALVEAGFVTSDGEITVDYERALGEALVSLPDLLSVEEKLEMITTLFKGTLVDDDFHHEEGAILVKAAGLLGVSPDRLNAHLADMDEVGDVDDDLEAAED